MTTADLVRDFCEEILDIAYCRAQDLLYSDDALKIRDIGYDILKVAEAALDGCESDALSESFDRVVSACQKRYWGEDA